MQQIDPGVHKNMQYHISVLCTVLFYYDNYHIHYVTSVSYCSTGHQLFKHYSKKQREKPEKILFICLIKKLYRHKYPSDSASMHTKYNVCPKKADPPPSKGMPQCQKRLVWPNQQGRITGPFACLVCVGLPSNKPPSLDTNVSH